jgi:hypothetical protein
MLVRGTASTVVAIGRKTGLSQGEAGSRQSFFLTAPYLSIWRDVPVERLPGSSQFAA